MARFLGEVGYGDTVEDPPGSGKWVDQITERRYSGDVLRNSRQLIGEGVNSDIGVENRISVVADQFAFDYFANIKYVRWAGGLWTVTNIEVQVPRLVLHLGSVYNGPTP